jgi:hypothetical protein
MKTLVSALFLIVAFSSISMAGDKTLTKPEAISEETIFLTEKISTNYDTLVIKEFSTEGVEYSSVNDEERKKIEAMFPLLKANIALTLEAALKEKKVFKAIIKNGEPTGKAVIMEGTFSEFNAGSRALKFFVGFGAGKAYIKFKGRLLDAATGKELALFEDRETGYRGAMTLESYEDLFPHQAKSIGENLAKFLIALY